MMPQPIFCQTPTKGLLNLAYARQIRCRNLHINMSWQFTCFITWSNGDKETFINKDAQAINQTIKKITQTKD
jgi:hypothetical protein